MAHSPEVRFVRHGRERLASGLRIPRHRHQYGYIAVVLAGAYQEAGLSGRLAVEASDVVVHRPFDSHLDKIASNGATVLNLPLPADAALPPAFRIADPDRVARIAERDPIAAAISLQPVGAVTRAGDWPDDLATVLHTGSKLSLREWAGANGLTPETISRGFRNAYGVTPAAFRAELRAHRALDLVRQGVASLAAIAVDCGFADQPHLTRAIVRLTGESPGSWRRRSIPFKTGANCGR